MSTTALANHLTRVTYILPKKDKALLEKAAASAKVSMSAVIHNALCDVGILPTRMAELNLELPESDKERLARAAKEAGVSVEALISQALAEKGILPQRVA